MSDFDPTGIVPEDARPRSTSSIERTASGKVAHKIRAVEGDSLSTLEDLVRTAYKAFSYQEKLIAGEEVLP